MVEPQDKITLTQSYTSMTRVIHRTTYKKDYYPQILTNIFTEIFLIMSCFRS
jgi:hypothetical protein